MPSAIRGPRSRLLTTLRILSAPFVWMPKWREKYGDPTRLPSLNGVVHMTGQPELAKAIFAADPNGYGPFATEAINGFAGPGSLLVISGARHLKERKLLSPPFRGSQMRALGPEMAAIAKRCFDEALDQADAKMGDVAQKISLEAIIRTVFGVQNDERVAVFREAILGYMRASNPLFFFVKAAQTPIFPPWRHFQRMFAKLDALLQEQIEAVRADPSAENILAAMVQARYDDGSPMQDEDVKSQLRTLLFAGHETTAITLAWAVDHIFRDEDLARRLCEHVDGLDDTAAAYSDSTVLENVWKETLRLHPVVTEALRTVTTPLRLGDYEVPAGEAVGASISMIHLDPSIYPDPERFDPDRFSERKYAAHEYLPFGGGHRRCLGAAFAGYQLQVVLGVLMRGYRVHLKQSVPPVPVRKNVAISPKGDVPITIERRSDAARDTAAAPSTTSSAMDQQVC